MPGGPGRCTEYRWLKLQLRRHDFPWLTAPSIPPPASSPTSRASTPSTPRTPASASAPATRWSPPCAVPSPSSAARPSSTPRTRPRARSTVNIKAASIDTGEADRDAHLRTADFFDAEHHPEITFVLTEGARNVADWTIIGDLTIRRHPPDHARLRGHRLGQGPVGQRAAAFEARPLNRRTSASPGTSRSRPAASWCRTRSSSTSTSPRSPSALPGTRVKSYPPTPALLSDRCRVEAISAHAVARSA